VTECECNDWWTAQNLETAVVCDLKAAFIQIFAWRASGKLSPTKRKLHSLATPVATYQTIQCRVPKDQRTYLHCNKSRKKKSPLYEIRSVTLLHIMLSSADPVPYVYNLLLLCKVNLLLLINTTRKRIENWRETPHILRFSATRSLASGSDSFPWGKCLKVHWTDGINWSKILSPSDRAEKTSRIHG
jgi:hypothetical protein